MAWKLQYNGFDFRESSTTVEIDCQLVYDEADRTVTYHKYMITAKSIVTPTSAGSPGDPQYNDNAYSIEQIRRKITKPFAKLIINGMGFGPDLTVNDETDEAGIKDVANGPKPRNVKWVPLGADQAAEVTWTCEFCIPFCEDGESARFSGLAAFTYSISQKTSPKGFGQRTVSGTLTIATTPKLVGSAYVCQDNADNYLDLIDVPLLSNYHREFTWDLSKDRLKLTWSVVDTQIESRTPYPPGVVEIDATHRAGLARRSSIARTQESLDVSITLAYDQPLSRAWEITRAIFIQCTSVAIANQKGFILQSIDVTREIFGGKMSFRLSWYILSPIEELFSVSGLYEDYQFNWPAWRASMNNIQTPRGISGITFESEEDSLVDLCDEPTPTPQNPTAPPTPPPSPRETFCNDTPAPEKSWIQFDSVIEVKNSHRVLITTTMGKADVTRTEFDVSNPAGTLPTINRTAYKEVISEAPPHAVLVWMGKAVRAGYPIPYPDLKKLGVVDMTIIGEPQFRQKQLGTYFCVPVYAATWVVEFSVSANVDPNYVDKTDPGQGV